MLQAEFLELIEFCFDKDFRSEVLGSLYPSERYSLWCKIRGRSPTYTRKETFDSCSFSPHGAKRPYGLAWEELDAFSAGNCSDSGSVRKEKFKQWQYEAVQKRDSCLNGGLSLGELIDWPEESMPNRKWIIQAVVLQQSKDEPDQLSGS